MVGVTGYADGIGSSGLVAELLPADAGSVHQPAFGYGKRRKPFAVVADVSLVVRTAAGWQGALSAQDPVSRWHHTCDVTPGILPFALRASLRLFKIAPGHFVEPADFIAKLAA